MTRIRLVPIIVVALVTLAMLFGLWQAYQHFQVVQPLRSSLEQLSGVQSVQLTQNGSTITVELGPVNKLQNDDFQTTYDSIVNRIQATVGGNVNLQLVDHHNTALTTAFESYIIILLEGAVKGDYTEAIAEVEAKAKTEGITARITMDRQNMYIQLSQGSHYLYHVEPYTTHEGGGTS